MSSLAKFPDSFPAGTRFFTKPASGAVFVLFPSGECALWSTFRGELVSKPLLDETSPDVDSITEDEARELESKALSELLAR